jgi:hypothetical protein
MICVNTANPVDMIGTYSLLSGQSGRGDKRVVSASHGFGAKKMYLPDLPREEIRLCANSASSNRPEEFNPRRIERGSYKDLEANLE